MRAATFFFGGFFLVIGLFIIFVKGGDNTPNIVNSLGGGLSSLGASLESGSKQ